MSVGAVASGAIGEQGSGGGEQYYATYVAPWLTSFGIAVGLFTLVCFAFLAAVYLTIEAQDVELREDFRRRALAAGAAVVVMAGVGIGLFRGVLAVHPSVVALVAVMLLATLASLWRRRYARARIGAAVAVTLIVWGWAFAQYPYLLPPDLTIAAAAAPAVTLRLALIAVLAGAALLFPSLYYLLRVFKLSRKTPSVAPPTMPPAPPR
jgi:cytochrome d ubiquinol oxidase subunit II